MTKRAIRTHTTISNKGHKGGGNGTFGRAVASHISGPRFESSHQLILFPVNWIEKTRMKMRPELAKLKKTKNTLFLNRLSNVSGTLISFFNKNWSNPGLFFVYFRSFQTSIIIIFKTDQCENVMSIQYTALGFEPTTFGTWAHNRYNCALVPHYFVNRLSYLNTVLAQISSLIRANMMVL